MGFNDMLYGVQADISKNASLTND